MHMARRLRVELGLALVVAAFATSAAACSTAPGSSGLPTSACDIAAKFVSSDPSRSAKRLDPVLRDCTSIEDLEAVGAKFGVALAGKDIIALARTRCRQVTAPRDGSLCGAILALPSSS